MDTGDQPGDDMLLGRLHEGAGDDAAVRQLRRRYDSLRNDYERLLDRLSVLEDRVAEPEERPRPDVMAPMASVSGRISEALAAPLVQLRDEYLAAANRLQGIVSGLERLAAGAMKGQHAPVAARPAPPPPPPPPPLPPVFAEREEPEAPPERPRKITLEVRGRGFGDLLDFQEKLSAMNGVARVSISSIDAERANLVVELRPADAPEPDDQPV